MLTLLWFFPCLVPLQLVGKDGIQVLEAASSVADEKKVTSPPPTMEVEAAAGVVAGDAMESA